MRSYMNEHIQTSRPGSILQRAEKEMSSADFLNARPRILACADRASLDSALVETRLMRLCLARPSETLESSLFVFLTALVGVTFSFLSYPSIHFIRFHLRAYWTIVT